MEYLFVFVLIVSFVLGGTTFLGAVVVLGRGRRSAGGKTNGRGPVAREFLIALGSYFVIMAGSTFLYYAEPLYSKDGLWYLLTLMGLRIATAVLLVSVILLMQEITGFPKSRRGRRTVGGVAVTLSVAFVTAFAVLLRLRPPGPEVVKFFDPTDAFIYAATAYVVVLFLARRRFIRNQTVKRVVTRFIVLAAGAVPLLLLDDFLLALGHNPQFHTFPLIYIAISGFFLYEGYVHLVVGGAPSRSGLSEARLNYYGITPRERELLEHVAEGLDNKAIGERLFISPATVRNHLHNVFEKTGARNRTQLVQLLRAPEE